MDVDVDRQRAASGRLIVIDGASSAGKTTLVRELQSRWDGPLLDAGLDRFLGMLPSRYLAPDLWRQIYRYEPTTGPIERIITGRLGQQLLHAMHTAWRPLTEAGMDVVADHVVLDRWTATDLVACTRSLRCFMVALTCPVTILEERERDRQVRTIGQATLQAGVLHRHLEYDLRLDSAELDPAALAAEVIGSARSRDR
jgi:chloramphenicol 3-O phosphotransferase